MMKDYPLELKHINMSFQDGDTRTTILSDLSFAIAPGEVIAIVGPSGSGKSTFLSIAGALLTPESGEVLLGGENIAAKSEKERTAIRLHSIGYIFQASNLVPYLTVRDQLLLLTKLAKSGSLARHQFVDDLLSMVEMDHRLMNYPHQLSGGEKQRVAIARAFVNRPDLILADEPTASLDAERSMTIMELISKLVKEQKKAAIIVTHDERALPYCDRIFRMEKGQLIEQPK